MSHGGPYLCSPAPHGSAWLRYNFSNITGIYIAVNTYFVPILDNHMKLLHFKANYRGLVEPHTVITKICKIMGLCTVDPDLCILH